MDESNELYNIREQFYTNQHHKVAGYNADQFAPEYQVKVLEFQIRSSIALGKDASPLIDAGKAKYSDNEELFLLLSAWNDLVSFGTDDSTYFQDVNVATFELQAVLTTIYLVKFEKDIDQAITFLTAYISKSNTFKKYHELEPYLILIQLHLAKGNFTAANKLFVKFDEFPESIRDNTIYNVVESWLNSIKGESDNINNSYYFYDELLTKNFNGDDDDIQGKFKVLHVLFVLTFKLQHNPEAQQILDQIDALGLKDGDLIANRISFDYVVNNGGNVDKLVKELESLDDAHPYLIDLKKRNDTFDEIVGKYA